MKLLIVESPNKIKKIRTYLGDDWNVAASVGHIRDLPDKEMGVHPPSFTPQYVVSPDKKKVVANLRKLASEADEVYLATDLDREGEAIAWHLKASLGLTSYKRVTFAEITKPAIQKALSAPRTIDQNLVAAQEARRVADRIVGYLVSPALSKQAQIALSAGRVQSPAVKLTVLREREIQAFKQQTFYGVRGVLPNGLEVDLIVKEWADNGKHIFSREIAEAISTIKQVQVTRIDCEPKEIKPRPPFTTSTLQQAASSVLKIAPAKTMELAQALFEGGYISYHRTDSPNLSQEAFDSIVEYAKSQGITPRAEQLKFNVKESAQEAHEAIRPTDISVEQAGTTDQERKLYALIRERALASCLPNAIDDVTTIEVTGTQKIEVGGRVSDPKFSATGRIERQPGWRSICAIESASNDDTHLPGGLALNETHPIKCSIIEKKTEPPQRFTEATLIKAMEKLGIGRPSTYSSIISTILKRQYIETIKVKKDTKIAPTQLGFDLVDALNPMTFMNLDYTRRLESQLDDIASGRLQYLPLVAALYDTITSELSLVSTKSRVKTAPCPRCERPLKQLTKGKNTFWVHIEDDEACEKFVSDLDGEPFLQNKDTRQCPKCGNAILRRHSKQKDFHFWVHEDPAHADDCMKFIKDIDGEPTQD